MDRICSDDSPLLAQRLLGKVALVTGGANGIGKAIVHLFLRHGAKVCIADIQSEDSQHLPNSNSDLAFIYCDVTNESDVENAIDFTVKKFGTLDVMVNNAGIVGTPCQNILEYEISTFEHIFQVNVKGVFLGMKHAARIMIPAKKGSIISMSSITGRIGGLGPHAYTGSKHAVVGLTKSVSAELGKHGIRVNCVSPYAVATRLAFPHMPEEEQSEDVVTGFRNFTRLKGNLQGEDVELTTNDVANAVLFLASDEAKYISGADLVVDGGFTSSNHALGVFR